MNIGEDYLTLMEQDIVKYSAEIECMLLFISLGDSTLKYKCKGLKVAQHLVCSCAKYSKKCDTHVLKSDADELHIF
jgi:hypothetical protein